MNQPANLRIRRARSRFLVVLLAGLSAWLCAQEPASTNQAQRVYETNKLKRGFMPWIDQFQKDVTILEDEFRVHAPDGRIALKGRFELLVPPPGHTLRIRFDAEQGDRANRYEIETARGVYTLGPDRDSQRWVALGPDGRRLADDDGVFEARRDGLLDLHNAGEEIILGRGPNQRLLAFPIDGPVTKLRFESWSVIWDYRVLKIDPPPASPLHAAELAPATETDWALEGDESEDITIERTGGTVRFATDNAHSTRRLLHTVPKANVWSGILKISAATHGSGIEIAHPGGKRMAVQFAVEPEQPQRIATTNFQDRPTQVASRKRGFFYDLPLFVRVVCTPLSMQIELSQSGQHFTLFDRVDLGGEREPHPATVSLLLVGGDREGTQSISASHAAFSTRDPFAAWRDKSIADQLPPLFDEADNHPERISPERRYKEILAARPDKIEEPAWRLATAHAFLTQRTSGEIRRRAFSDGIEASLAAERPIEESLDALRVMLELVPAHPTHGNRPPPYSELASKIGARIVTERAWEHAPRWLESWYELRHNIAEVRFGTERKGPPPLVRAWMYEHQHRQDWEGLLRAVRQYNFYSRPVLENRLPFWMEEQALAKLASVDPEAVDPVGDIQSRLGPNHPMALTSDRETLNLLAEFHAAAEANEFERACRIIIHGETAQGLVEDPADFDLHRRARHMVRGAVDKYPELRAQMSKEFLPIGRIRISQAIADDRIRDLEPLSALFHGTEVARRAHLVMADRDLSLGRFEKAATRYADVLDVSGEDDEQVKTRQQLALALAGQAVIPTRKPTVELPGGTLDATSFNQLLKAGTSTARVQTRIRERWPESVEAVPGNKPIRLNHGYHTETTPLPDGGTLITQDGTLHVLDGTNLRWRVDITRVNLPKLSARAAANRELAFVAVPNPDLRSLFAYHIADGKPAWKTDLKQTIAGDPVLLGHRLIVPTRQGHMLNIQTFEAAQGRLIGSHPVGRYLPPTQWPRWIRNVALTDGTGALLAGTGFVMRLEPSGDVRWLRRMPLIPPMSDTDESLLRVGRPVVNGDKVAVLLPGSMSVSCLEVDSGELVWDFPTPGLELAGAVGDQFLVRHGYGLEALAVGNGASSWRHGISSDQSALLLQGDSFVELTLLEESAVLRRIDATGKRVHATPVHFDGKAVGDIKLLITAFPADAGVIAVTGDVLAEEPRLNHNARLLEIQP